MGMDPITARVNSDSVKTQFIHQDVTNAAVIDGHIHLTISVRLRTTGVNPKLLVFWNPNNTGLDSASHVRAEIRLTGTNPFTFNNLARNGSILYALPLMRIVA